MRAYIFSKRNGKEILRDPINLFFGLGFPLILMFLFSIINTAIPPEANNTMFETKRIAPGIAMFGTVFLALFSGTLLAKDRTSSFLMRLFSSPMRSFDFIMGYTLPMILFAVVQSSITLIAASFIGLPLTINTFLAVFVLVPISILFVGVGLLCGSIMNDKAVGGICGALLTNIAGWFSGTWIPIDLIGGRFRTISHFLPFFHAAETARLAIEGKYVDILPHLSIVLAYSLIVYGIAIFVFRYKMSSDRT